MVDVATVWEGWRAGEQITQDSLGEVYRISKGEQESVAYAMARFIAVPRDEAQIQALSGMGMSRQELCDRFEIQARRAADQFGVMRGFSGYSSNVLRIEDCCVIRNDDGIGWTVCVRTESLESLTDQMRMQGPPGLEEALSIGIDVCSALRCFESNGMTHGNVRPQNVFRSTGGGYKLGCFDVTRCFERGKSNLSASGADADLYMAPEAIRGGEHSSSEDVYALGIMLYRFLNGLRFPFFPPIPFPVSPDDMEQARLRLIRGDALPAPSGADSELSRIILRACHPDPKMRYASADALLADLVAYRNRFSKNRSPLPNSDSIFEYGRVQHSQVNPSPITNPQPIPGPQLDPEPLSPKKKGKLPVALGICALAVVLAFVAFVGLGKLDSIAGVGDGQQKLEAEETEIPTYEGIQVRGALDEYSWSELSSISEVISSASSSKDAAEIASEFNISLGQSKEIEGDLPGEIKAVLVGFNHDKDEDGNVVGMTFMTSDCVEMAAFDRWGNTCGGWEASDVRSRLEDITLDQISEDLSTVIVPVLKQTNCAGGHYGYVEDFVTTQDRLWLFSLVEVAGTQKTQANQAISDCYNGEGRQYEYFKKLGIQPRYSNPELTRCFESEKADWWLRTIFYSSSEKTQTTWEVRVVKENGRLVGDTAGTKVVNKVPRKDVDHRAGVVFGFCI